MKRALLINAVCGIRSTGKICVDLAEKLEKEGYEVKIAYSRESVPDKYEKFAVKIGKKRDVYWHALMTKLFDDRGNWSRFATRRFLKWVESFQPDLIWIHNIHDYVLNLDIFFNWLKQNPEIEVRWTQHDCWAFTGGCMHFVDKNCNQWIDGCKECPDRISKCKLPLIHREQINYIKKKELFSGIKTMTIITPSKWLADLVEHSFLKQYNIEIHHNTIDYSIFKPTEGMFRNRYGIQNKIVVLGVASAWSTSKGLNDFYKLAARLSDDYQIVMVGLSKKQLEELPENILGIERTNNQLELAEIYTMADIFVNPTYADNYPTVNLEAEACGTPVLCYDVGGCKETIRLPGSQCVGVGDVDQLITIITDNYKRKEQL